MDNGITVATMFLGLLTTNTEFRGKGACAMMAWLLFLGDAIVVIVAFLWCPCFRARALRRRRGAMEIKFKRERVGNAPLVVTSGGLMVSILRPFFANK